MVGRFGRERIGASAYFFELGVGARSGPGQRQAGDANNAREGHGKSCAKRASLQRTAQKS